MRKSIVSGMACVAVLALTGTVAAHDLSVVKAWARATPGNAGTGAAYLTVRNEAFHPEVLIGVSTPAARRAEIHNHSNEGGVMRMRRVGAVEIPLDDSVTFRPGGFHVMLVGLTTTLKEGNKFPLHLRFKSGEKIAVTVEVMGIGSMGPDAAMPNAPREMPQGRAPANGHGTHAPAGHLNR